MHVSGIKLTNKKIKASRPCQASTKRYLHIPRLVESIIIIFVSLGDPLNLLAFRDSPLVHLALNGSCM